MLSNLEELKNRRNLARKLLDDTNREIQILEELIKKAEQNIKSEKKYTSKARDSIYYTGKIKDILRANEKGLRTRDLYHLFEIFYERKINDSTFRSYLYRMKKNEEIYQDKEKKWQLKE